MYVKILAMTYFVIAFHISKSELSNTAALFFVLNCPEWGVSTGTQWQDDNWSIEYCYVCEIDLNRSRAPFARP